MRGEITSLQAFIEHHPELRRYKIENENLRADMDRLKAGQSIDNINLQRAQELMEIFTKLQSQVDSCKQKHYMWYFILVFIYWFIEKQGFVEFQAHQFLCSFLFFSSI